MEALILGAGWEAQQWRLMLENADETWRCSCTDSAARGAAAASRFDLMILCAGREADRLLMQLTQEPPVRCPWLVGDGWTHPLLDAVCPLSNAGSLPAVLTQLMRQRTLPRLTQLVLPQLTGRAADLLHTLEMQPRLGAWVFLPQMLALGAACPSLLQDVNRRLYPMCGEKHQLTAACVERRLRLAVESTWNRSSLDVLDTFFGQTIDPQRGKPTNKEFLAQLCQCLRQDMQHA